jgi:predicted transcriptional regulator
MSRPNRQALPPAWIDVCGPPRLTVAAETHTSRGDCAMTDALGADNAARLMDSATEVVAAFVGNNSLPVSELPGLIAQVHAALVGLARRENSTSPALPASPPEAAVPIKKSVTDDYLVCLEDGHRFKTLKRHLRTDHGLTPESYRSKWHLPHDYPMAAPSYQRTRSALAKKAGLGQQRRAHKKT